MKIQLRHDTAAAWIAANPVLDKGEFGAEDDTQLFKKGDGVTAWNDLAYGGISGANGKDGQIRFTGHGAPGTIVNSEPGDTYLDLDTGTVYKLI